MIARTRRSLQIYGFFLALVGPAALLRLFTSVYPVARVIEWSFFKINPLDQLHRFVGFDNFVKLVQDPVAQASISFTIIFVVASTVLQVVLGMAVAQFLNAEFTGQKVARTINLLPWSIPLIVATMAFGWLFDDQFGMINDILFRFFGIRREWLVNPVTARVAVILTNVWKNTPFIAMVFLAGLQGLPQELYDSAKVDGAGAWHSFWRITVPLVSPLVTTISIFFAVWQLATFDIVYGLTQGGPGFATSLLSYQIYQEAFVAFNFGYSSAISIVLLFVVAIIAIAGFSIFKKQEVSY